jgi:motility quorum-sensing regulator/GCU-specific mRNA interferase toxin
VEKGAPHCKLPIVKALIEAGRVKATVSAYNGARELGINDLAGMCAVVLALTPDHFYKSMTTHADHRIWQDVYRTRIENGVDQGGAELRRASSRSFGEPRGHEVSSAGVDVYLKLTVIEDVLIVSFKEL